jgi:hypothetical protein
MNEVSRAIRGGLAGLVPGWAGLGLGWGWGRRPRSGTA